jgi:hypothetical protein
MRARNWLWGVSADALEILGGSFRLCLADLRDEDFVH